jgi:DNA-binding NarL/FixJ family response regulator
MDREPTPLRASTVLICDDHAAMRGMLGAIVDLIPGMRVVGEAANGQVAISEASRLQPDVILLDLAMPVLSGLDALPHLRQTAAAAKIIVVAGFSRATVADQVLALGADRYLEKGASLETIEHALAETTAPVRPETVGLK